MAAVTNACYRCKTRIDSGLSFCRDCGEEVSLAFPYTRDTRLWVVLAVAPVLALALLGLPAAAGALSVGPPGLLGLGTMLAVPLSLAFGYALYRDCQHVRRRDDADWEPSEWGYAALAVGSALLIVPMFVVAPYHLRKRRAAIGLVL